MSISKQDKNKKLRPVGSILLDMEPLLFELTDRHGLQHGDILYLLKGWLDVHASDALEVYEEGGSPVLRYGPEDR